MLLLLRAMVGFQALHLKPTKPRTKLKKKKEIIVEMLAARKSNEKKGAVEEHNLANLTCITKTLSGTSSVLEIENILMALEQIAQLEMATGKDKDVVHNSSTIGMRKSLVFHVEKLPKGSRTDWMMYEYRQESKELVDAGFF
ncbi:uncharacterized protein LOC121975650 [Zingiber officinale]|uniref:uncharacterized protein LOC121975650 n=1 Tax=Zingiber officinale TaxID=94328 RepID=UPI001C4C2A2A|nr:uncharacterized protein LOC121975650 [Zingiber officinale]